MKILFVVHGWPPGSIGGVEIYARRMATWLAKENEIYVFTREANSSKPDYSIRSVRDGEIELTKVNYNFGDVDDFRSSYENEAIAEIFDRYVEQFAPFDVAHIHHLGGLGHSVARVLEKRTVPFVMTFHDFTLTCPRGQRIRDDHTICERLSVRACVECLKPQCKGASFGTAGKLFKYFFRKQEGADLLERYWKSSESVANAAKALIAPSFHHAKIMEQDGFPKSKISVMPYGYDVESFAAIKREKIESVKKFGYLGSLIPSKGVHLIIEAFRKIKRLYPELDVELHLHGGAPPYHGKKDYLKYLQTRAQKLPVTFHGSYDPDEIYSVLASLDAVVVPSLWWESHGMVVREAKLAGLPVIVSGHGAVCEAIQDNKNGVVFRPGNMMHLRDKIYMLASNPMLADALAKEPIDVVSIEQDVAAHIELYKNV